MIIEIAAHSRFLTTMVLHADENLLLTAAQDGTAVVWDLTDLGMDQVKVRHSCLWNNSMITGGAFISGKKVYLSSYSEAVLGVCEYA